MSAFVVSKHDIDILVTALADQWGHPQTLALNRLGRDLWRENVESVAWRYDLRAGPKRSDKRAELAGYLRQARAYQFTRRIAHRAAVAKIARCWDYQSCEHPHYELSTAKRAVDGLIERFPDTLPLYDKMPWGIAGPEDLMRAGCLALPSED